MGVSGHGVVRTALEKVRGKDFEELCETIKRIAFKVTRVGQLVAREASRQMESLLEFLTLSGIIADKAAIGMINQKTTAVSLI